MKYVCLGFIDQQKFATVPPADAQRMMEECFAYDDELRRDGHFLGGEALDSALNGVTMKYQNGQVEVTAGPFAETREVLGGILLLEARDLNHAISLMSKHPGMKMGPWEIRPANEAINQLIALRNAGVNIQSALSTERLLSATPRQIFNAFEQPEKLAQWWGPDGFTNTFSQFDFKPGGRWVFVMHGPNGANYPNESVFREIDRDSRIVIEHVAQPWFKLTITLTPKGQQTLLSWVQQFDSPEMASKMRPICNPANEQNLNRLQAVLARG